MKKYEYKILNAAQKDILLKKINDFGKQGWKILNINYSDSGNEAIVVLEKEWEEIVNFKDIF